MASLKEKLEAWIAKPKQEHEDAEGEGDQNAPVDEVDELDDNPDVPDVGEVAAEEGEGTILKVLKYY